MTIILTNIAEAGMPDEMIGHCQQLLAWRIQKTYDSLPQEGEDIEILYSEKDPLQKTAEIDDNAYMLYFTVEKAEVAEGKTLDEATIHLALAF